MKASSWYHNGKPRQPHGPWLSIILFLAILANGLTLLVRTAVSECGENEGDWTLELSGITMDGAEIATPEGEFWENLKERCLFSSSDMDLPEEERLFYTIKAWSYTGGGSWDLEYGP